VCDSNTEIECIHNLLRALLEFWCDYREW